MSEKALVVPMAAGAFLLWAWLTRKLDRGHMGADRSLDHYLREQDNRWDAYLYPARDGYRYQRRAIQPGLATANGAHQRDDRLSWAVTLG